MARRKRRKFSDEFKQEAVRLCSEGHRLHYFHLVIRGMKCAWRFPEQIRVRG